MPSLLKSSMFATEEPSRPSLARSDKPVVVGGEPFIAVTGVKY